jgi:hypothetical protein
MGWLAFLRLTGIFLVFYLALPALATAAGQHRQWAAAFVRFAFFIEFAGLLLGIGHFALPGALFSVCLLWLAADALSHVPKFVKSADARRQWILGCISSRPRFRFRNFALWLGDRHAQWWAALFIALLCQRAWFPVHNLRLTSWDGYSRALSLAQLGSGQAWLVDPSVPILLPLYFLGAMPSPVVIALAAPLVTAVLVCAAGFACYRVCSNPAAAFLAAGCTALVSFSTAGMQKTTVEFAALFALLGIGLWKNSRSDAARCAVLAVAFAAPVVSLPDLIPVPLYLTCTLLGIAASRLAQPSVTWAIAIASILALLRPLSPSPEGPFQYEAAARVALHLSDTLPQNTWTVVSPSHELSYIYGRGWHVELADFLSAVDPAKVADPQFRFGLPVENIFFFVERQPLQPIAGSGRLRPSIRVASTPAANYATSMERASLEFQAGLLLANYGKHHSDLEKIYDDGNLLVFRAPGAPPTKL